MSKLEYYGISNGVGVLFCIVFLLVGIIKYKNKSYKEQLKPLRFIYITAIILEIIKITYHMVSKSTFPTNRYPIVFCSLIMYTYPIICHLDRESMAVRVSKAISIVPSLVIGGLYLFIFPETINPTQYNFLMNLHSRFYHFMMLAGAIYMIVLKLYDFRFKDYFMSAVVAGGYIQLCTFFSLLIGGDLSYFGPDSGVLKSFYELFGFATGNVFITLAIFLVSFLIFYFIKFFQEKHSKTTS